MTRMILMSTAVTGLFLAGCGNDTAQKMPADTPPAPVKMLTQTFSVINVDGNPLGTVQIEDTAVGVDVTLDLTAIPEGDHAIHFHENGLCDGPDFKSAGGHYNPMTVMHGFETETGPHAGDMRNFAAPSSGVVKQTVSNARVSLSKRSGFAPLFDEHGTALIIHAAADDYVSQPSGAAGSRIACAVINK